MRSKRRKKGLTFEEHQQLGNTLKRIKRDVDGALSLLLPSYRVNAKCFRWLSRVIYDLDRLRSEMDDQLYAEHRALKCPELPRVYYGTRAPIRLIPGRKP